MQRHFRIDDIERYIEGSTSEEDLDWFEEALEHLMSCQFCQQKLATRMQIEDICDPEGVGLSIGLQELSKKKERINPDRFGGKTNYEPPYGIKPDNSKPYNVAASQDGRFLVDDAVELHPYSEKSQEQTENKKKSLWKRIFNRRNKK